MSGEDESARPKVSRSNRQAQQDARAALNDSTPRERALAALRLGEFLATLSRKHGTRGEDPAGS